MLSDTKNTKLGNLIHSWAIPAGITCPGETQLCRHRCYAMRGFFQMGSVRAAHVKNLVFSRTEDFVPWMKSALTAASARVMRIHVGGDFYDIEYTRKWYDIVAARRRVIFYAYTRSWQEEEILPDLISLSKLPNMVMWWSVDRETGPAPLVPGVRRAYLAIDDVDANLAPDDCDLVFRDKPLTVMKRANTVLVCPVENGVHSEKFKHTCTSCGLCWDKARRPLWEPSVLPYDAEAAEINAP